MRVVVDVPDGSHLQLLADALAEAASMRTRAAGRAARDVIGDPAIADKRPDAARLLQVVADADWIRSVAEQLPLLVIDDAPAPPAPTPAAPAPDGLAPTFLPPAGWPSHPDVAAAPPAPEPAGRRGPPELDPAQVARIRALTVPEGARLTPGAPPVAVDGPPQALTEAAARRAAEESLSDIADFTDGG